MIKNLIKKMFKYPIRLVNNIYTYFYYRKSQKVKEHEIDDMLTVREKVLVFSPHVDDETIGLGATLLKYKRMGNQMSLVYMTDGGGSTSDLSRQQLIEERRKEAYKVKKAYKFDEVYFLDELDGELKSSKEELNEKIIDILNKEQPSIIFTPFLIDGHRDHVETTKSVMKALETWNKDFENIYMYEVNCPILSNVVNSISLMDQDLYNKKGNIYKIFSSQWAMGFDVFRLLDRRKTYLIEDIQNSYGAEVFVKTDFKSLKRIEDMLTKENFKPENFRQLSSEYNLLFSFKTNENLKKEYSNKVDNILAENTIA